jgi:multidrug efflux pump subunit AcrA (membrane-fusion protein)
LTVKAPDFPDTQQNCSFSTYLTMKFNNLSGMLIRLALFTFATGLIACGGKEEKKEEQTSYQGAPTQAAEVVGVGRVEPEQDIISLAANEGGVVSKLYIREGDAVRAGTVVLELENTVASARVTQARARLATQEAQVLADEKAEAEAQIRLENLKLNAQRLQKLFDSRVETEQNRDNANYEVRNQQAACDRLRASAQVSRARLQETRTELAVAERELALRSVKAPVNGQILSISTQAGNALPPQGQFAELAPEGRIIVRCEIDELLADRVQTDQKAVIRAIGTGKELASGTVVYAAPLLKKKSLFAETPGEMEDRRVREVKILLNNPGALLLNARVECAIQL